MSVLNHLEDILASHQQSNTSGSSVNHDLSDNHQNQDASATDQNNTRGDIKLKITDDWAALLDRFSAGLLFYAAIGHQF